MFGTARSRNFSSSAICNVQNHYKVLGVSVNASADHIKKQFFELSKKYHPDRNNDADPERYQEITAAYTVLSNDADRKKFDESLGTAVRRPEGYHSGRSWGSHESASTSHRRRPGTSGYSYNFKSMRQHKARQSSKLDPLRPQNQDSEVPHFNFAKHAESHARYEEYRKQARDQRKYNQRMSGNFKPSAATASMGDDTKRTDPHIAGASFILKALGATAAGLSVVYLLLRR